jgi:hypothetical protein
MANRHDPSRFVARLLGQDDPLSDAQYQEYRRGLDDALRAAERRERLAGRVAVGSCAVSLTLMFVGGSKLIGDFDPWSKGASVVSVAAGVVYLLATTLFFLSLASYYSRFRPRVRDVKERLRDLVLLDLQRQIRELREQAGRHSGRDEPDSGPPKSG